MNKQTNDRNKRSRK